MTHEELMANFWKQTCPPCFHNQRTDENFSLSKRKRKMCKTANLGDPKSTDPASKHQMRQLHQTNNQTHDPRNRPVSQPMGHLIPGRPWPSSKMMTGALSPLLCTTSHTVNTFKLPDVETAKTLLPQNIPDRKADAPGREQTATAQSLFHTAMGHAG